MSKSHLSTPRAASTASRKSLGVRSMVQQPHMVGTLTYKPMRAKSKASKMSTYERLNPLLPTKNANIPKEKRLANLISTFAAKLNPFLLDDSANQLEYFEIYRKLKAKVNDKNDFWNSWFEFKTKFLDDVESAKEEYKDSRAPEKVIQMCHDNFNKFSQEISEIRNNHRNKFKKFYHPKFKELMNEFNQMQKIIDTKLKRHNELKLFIRDLQFIIIQLESFQDMLPVEHDRFFSEPFDPQFTDTQFSKAQIVSMVLAPIKDTITSLKMFMDPSIVTEQASSEIQKIEDSIKNLIGDPSNRLQARYKSEKGDNMNDEEASKISDLKGIIQELEEQKSQLDSELQEKLSYKESKINEITRRSEEWENEKKEIQKEIKNLSSSGNSPENQAKRIKQLEKEVQEKESELAKYDESNTKQQYKENQKKFEELRNQLKTIQTDIIYQRALIQVKSNSLSPEVKTSYTRYLELIKSTSSQEHQLESIQFVTNNYRNFQQRFKGQSPNLPPVEDPLDRLQLMADKNKASFDKIEELIEENYKIKDKLLAARTEMASTYALEEINAEQGKKYQRAIRRLQKIITSEPLAQDTRPVPIVWAEALLKRAEISEVQCKIDSFTKGTEGSELAHNIKDSVSQSMVSVQARENALSTVIKSIKDGDIENIEEEANRVEKESERVKRDLDNYSAAVKKIEDKLHLKGNGGDLNDRIAAIIAVISKK